MTKTLVQAISVGLTTGVIVSAFRWIIDQTMKLLYQIYPQMAAQRVLIVPYILLMFIIAITLGKITAPYLDQPLRPFQYKDLHDLALIQDR